MPRSRAIVGYFCSAVLLWMSVAAGHFLPATMTTDAATKAAAHGKHPTEAHGVSGKHAHASGHHHSEAKVTEKLPGKTAACIAECLDRIADKLHARAGAFDFAPGSNWMAVAWQPFKLDFSGWQAVHVGNWPTGPPDPRPRSGSGSERIVALNRRLRI